MSFSPLTPTLIIFAVLLLLLMALRTLIAIAMFTAGAAGYVLQAGYSGRLSTGTLAAGGMLGILIPPSVPLVIHAMLAEPNIAKLFAAAMIPGIPAMLGYMVASAIYVRVVPGHAPSRKTRPN